MNRLPISLLGAEPESPFPPAEHALREPNGLLAAGGDLSPVRLLNAYRQGVFPWFGEGQPILWWSPDPRVVFDTSRFSLSTRMRRSLRTSDWILRADTAFARVLSACAATPRPGQDGTWITADMADSYVRLHRLGHAHSVEVFAGESLVGGIYGVAIGRMFFGESMFSGQSGGSKVALAGLARLLAQWGWPLIDAQVENNHLLSLGARLVPRSEFLRSIRALATQEGRLGPWTASMPGMAATELCKSLD